MLKINLSLIKPIHERCIEKLFWNHILLLGIIVGSIIGIVAPGFVEYIKPFGEIFF